MKIRYLNIIGLSALALVSSTAWSQGRPPVTAYDGNGDGYVSEQEFLEARAARQKARAEEGRLLRGAQTAPAFADWDTDKDGRLSAQELATGRDARRQERWANRPHRYGAGRRCGAGS